MKKRVALCSIKRGEKVANLSSRLTAPIRSVALMAILLFMASACGGSDKPEVEEGDVLVVLDDTTLMLHDVLNCIPVGMDPQDSVAMFHSIVNNWVKTRVLTDLAESKLPDVRHIDRQVEAYRNRLIVAEYLKKMRDGKRFKISEDSVKAFYEAHKSELLTEIPLVKGIYLKVASSSPGLAEIRQLMSEGSDKSVDRLEKTWIGDAIQYDYFENRWVDWQTIADQIPYRFYDPDAFLASTKNFETSYKESTYFLHITDYLPSGSVQPYKFARHGIADMMERAKMTSYEEALVNSLIAKAVKENRLVAVGYDPVSHKATGNGKIKENKKSKDEKE